MDEEITAKLVRVHAINREIGALNSQHVADIRERVEQVVALEAEVARARAAKTEEKGEYEEITSAVVTFLESHKRTADVAYRHKIATRDKEVAALKAQLAEKDKEVAALKAQLAEKDAKAQETIESDETMRDAESLEDYAKHVERQMQLISRLLKQPTSW